MNIGTIFILFLIKTKAMEMRTIQVLNGPDVWNNHTRKLIQMRVDIGDFKSKLTNTIDGFSDRLKNLIPSLYSHTDSEGMAGGFFKSIDKGTSIAQVIAHIAIELQCLAGMQTESSKTVQTDTFGVYNVVFNSIDGDVGVFAALASVEIVEALINAKPYFIRHDINRLKYLYQKNHSSVQTIKFAQSTPNFRVDKQEVKWTYVDRTA